MNKPNKVMTKSQMKQLAQKSKAVASFGSEEYIEQTDSMLTELEQHKARQAKLLEHSDTSIGDRKDIQ